MNNVSPLFEINPFYTPPPSTIRFADSNNCLRHPKKLDIKPIEDFESILNILCINCQELINVSKIDYHSKLCIHPSEKVLQLEKDNEIEAVRFKITNLKNVLEEIALKPKLNPCDKNYIIVLIRNSLTVLNTRNLQVLENIIDSLNTILYSFKGSLCIRIYTERFTSLVAQLIGYLIIESNLNTQILGKKNIFKDIEIKSLQEQVEYYKSRAEILQKVVVKTQNMKLPEINRKVEAIRSELGSLSPSGSSNSSILFDERPFSPMGSSDEENKNQEEMKKYFYSLCLKQKINLSTNKKYKPNLSISKMLQDVIDKNIPPENWQDFVSTQFSNPDRKFVEQKPQRRSLRHK
ncbi:hypothetical protein SteCoe_5011 [Stentor coeruleus]|uniref:Uncharacterized protein n=1 Tax=Stentor coeruleus TaxID=5963 RepID=A0A1R2CTB7_9CILI|nr:hypothetical protein SteCoe_5011 [Stentor coeruleus]